MPFATIAVSTVLLQFGCYIRIDCQVYEQCFFNKRTPGSRQLRTLMIKFSSNAVAPYAWGASFTGTSPPTPSQHELKLRQCILDLSMSASRAAVVLQQINTESPWDSTVQFVEAIAALSTVHKDEMTRKSHVQGQSIRKLLWNMTSPSRLQWLFNNQRLRLGMNKQKLALLPVGTCANEAV